MRLLYLCADRGIPIRGDKGAAVHVRTLTDALVRAGHTVTILTPRPGPADGPAPLAALRHVPLPELPTGGLDPDAARDRQAQAYAGVLASAAAELLAAAPFDAIYERYSLWSDAGARLARATGLPLVLEVNAPLRQEAAAYRVLSDADLAARVEAAQLAQAHAVAVVSEPLREMVIARGADPARVHVLPNGVDPAQFHPAVRGGKLRDRYGLSDRIVLGFVGRPRPWHDLETLLAALRQLRAADERFHLLLVGQMPAELPARLAALGLAGAVTQTGPVPHAAVPAHVAAMDVAVSPHPALADFYFSPLKLVEYLACGVPTVAAAVGQPAQLIRHGETGWLYPPGDAAALADCVRQLLADPARARQVAWQGAAEVLGQYTWDRHAATVAGWLRPVAERGAKRPSAALPLLDAKLRQRLYRATRPDLAGPLLARRLPGFRSRGTAVPAEPALRFQGVQQIDVLKYKPGRRCVLAYSLAGRERQAGRPRRLQVIGKVFRDDRGQRLHRLHQQLWRAGFGAHAADGISVPASLAYVPEMRMQVQALAPGQTLNERLADGAIAPLIPLTARGLAKLHALPAGAGGVTPWRQYLLGDELQSLDRFLAELAERRPRALSAVRSLRDALCAWADTLPPADALTPVHRDFYYSQVLYAGGRLTLIDFDLFALGDPAIDVANFTAHLVFLGMDRLGRADALMADAALFLESYARLRPVDDAFLARHQFYQAATFYRLLNVVSSRPGLAHLFDDLLRRAAACLEAA